MENLIRGSVCLGSDQEIASRSGRLGLRGPRLDAGLLGCHQKCSAPLLEAIQAGEDTVCKMCSLLAR